jgi:RNA polymerase sigma-70 factor (ECF subfamily)
VTPRFGTSGGPADAELVSQVVGGDGAAFGPIVERYQDRLYNTVYRMVGSAEDARDLVQEVFVKAYENLASFKGTSSLYTWLFRIAVNASLSHRRKRRWVRLAGPAADPGDGEAARPVESPAGHGTSRSRARGATGNWPDPADGDPAREMLAAETEAAVQQALAQLDDEHRTVVVLRDVQHCDYREIADILGVPTGTVKSRLHRARLLLRDKLQPLLKA